MNDSVETIVAEAAQLPPDQRLMPAHRILSSLEPEPSAEIDAALRNLIASYRESGSGENRSRWIVNATTYFLSKERPPILSLLGNDACVVMHGSTTRNVDDPYSDLDFYLLLNDEATARFDSACSSRFVDVIIDGKVGHLNVTTFDALQSAFAAPDLETIYELQHAVAILDPGERFAPISQRARAPMSDRLRRASLLYNYIEMRSFHRSADNPIERHDRLAALSSIIEATHFAIRCARVIDGMTYPYSKWLYVAAGACPTGRLLLGFIDQILDLVQTDPNALVGPEKANATSTLLRKIRATIVDCSKGIGIDEPWLTQWWHFFDEQRAVFQDVEWSV